MEFEERDQELTIWMLWTILGSSIVTGKNKGIVLGFMLTSLSEYNPIFAETEVSEGKEYSFEEGNHIFYWGYLDAAY